MVTKDTVRDVLERMMLEHPDFDAKMKFGSRGYEMRGKLCAGVYQDLLVLNLGKELVDQILAQGNSRPMDLIGRVLEDWVMLEEPIYSNEAKMKELIDIAADRVRALFT